MAKKKPEPPPPFSNPGLFAGTLANCIRRHMDPATLAELSLAAQGLDFVIEAAATTPEAVLQQLRQSEHAWKHLEMMESEVYHFIAGFITKCQEIASTNATIPDAPSEVN